VVYAVRAICPLLVALVFLVVVVLRQVGRWLQQCSFYVSLKVGDRLRSAWRVFDACHVHRST
jgi:hypothetical protein